MSNSDTVLGICVIVGISLAILFVGYQAGKWANSGTAGDSAEQQSTSPPDDPSTPKSDDSQSSAEKHSDADLVNSAPNLHTIYKKGRDDSKDETSGDPRPDPELKHTREDLSDSERNDNDKDATIDAMVKRLLEKVERGEITLQCACNAGSQGACGGSECGGKNVTHVTSVTHVTRLEYRCLLGDDIRWGILENDLKKAIAEEMDQNTARTREETRTAMKAQEMSLEGQIQEARLWATQEHDKGMAEMDRRLRDLDGRLALEPQVMEIRGFMKIDTFGPVLLGIGAMQILLLLCISLLFMRPR